MADQKLTALDTIADVASDDLLYIVDYDLTASKKVAVSNLVNTAFGEGCRVYNDTDITLTHNTDTPLTFNSERYDTDTIHDLVSNTGRLTCKTAGVYIIVGNVEFDGNATGNRQLWVYLNGDTDIGRSCLVPGGATAALRLCIATLYYLNVNDYVELYVYQNSGGDLDINSIGNYSPEFSMQRISA